MSMIRKTGSKLLVSALMAGALFSAPAMADDNNVFADYGKDKVYDITKLPYYEDASFAIQYGKNKGEYLITLDPEKMSTSSDISWSSTYRNKSSQVYIPLYDINPIYIDETQPYYYLTSHSNIITKKINDELSNVGNSSNRALFYRINDGAVYNTKDKSGVSVFADFTNNASANGGGVQNTGKIGSITGDFISNIGGAKGGAVYNKGEISNLTGNYISNKANNGGAIYNSGKITNIIGDFIGNHAYDKGGAIYNEGMITNINGNFVANYIDFDNSDGQGGAIYNAASGEIQNITGDFIANQVAHYGGGIYNEGHIGNIKGNFIANTGDDRSGFQGGIIINGGVIDSIEGLFQANKNKYDNHYMIINHGTINNLSADFIDNPVGFSQGWMDGMIFNTRGGNLSIVTTDTHPIINFTNNIAVDRSPDKTVAVLNMGTLNLLAKEGQQINFNNGEYIVSDDTAFNIGNENYTGVVNLAGVVSDYYLYKNEIKNEYESDSWLLPDMMNPGEVSQGEGTININGGTVNIRGDVSQERIIVNENATLNLGNNALIATSILGDGNVNVLANNSVRFLPMYTSDFAEDSGQVTMMAHNLHLQDFSGINQANGLIEKFSIENFSGSSHNTLGLDVLLDDWGELKCDEIFVDNPSNLTFDVTEINSNISLFSLPETIYSFGNNNIKINNSFADDFYIKREGDYALTLTPMLLKLDAALFLTPHPDVENPSEYPVQSYKLHSTAPIYNPGSDTYVLKRYKHDEPRVLTIYGNKEPLDSGMFLPGITVDARAGNGELLPENDPGDNLTLRNVSMLNFLNSADETILRNIVYDENYYSVYDGLGGAIKNADTVTIVADDRVVTFSGNYADVGGAIYNTGKLNLLAKTEINFDGSFDESMLPNFYGDAVYAYANFDSVHNEGTININRYDSPVDGKIIYDGTVKFNVVTDNDTPKGIINIYGGNVEVKDDFTQNTVMNNGTLSFKKVSKYFDEDKWDYVTVANYEKTANINNLSGNGTLDIYGGKVNIKNDITQKSINVMNGTLGLIDGKTSNVTVDNFAIASSKDASLTIDVDLTNKDTGDYAAYQKSDRIIANTISNIVDNNVATGKVTVHVSKTNIFNIPETLADGTKIKLFDGNGVNENLKIATFAEAFGGNTYYIFTQDANSRGDLIVTKGTGQPLLNDGEPEYPGRIYTLPEIIRGVVLGVDITAYNLTKDETLTQALGSLGNGLLSQTPRIFTIKGNGNTLNGGNYEGVTVNADQKLYLQNITMENFKTAAVTNNENGYVEINNSTFKNNETDILNNGNLKFTGIENEVDTIKGTGTTDVQALQLTVNKELTQDKVVLQSDANLINNGNINVTKIDSQDGVFIANQGSAFAGTFENGSFISNGNNDFTGTLTPQNLYLQNGMLQMHSVLGTTDTYANGGGLNLSNNSCGVADLGNLHLNANMPLVLDADLAGDKMDQLKITSLADDTGTLKITDIHLLSATTKDEVSLDLFADETTKTALKGKVSGDLTGLKYSPTYIYDAKYSTDDGKVSFTKTGVNPYIYVPATMAQTTANIIGQIAGLAMDKLDVSVVGGEKGLAAGDMPKANNAWVKVMGFDDDAEFKGLNNTIDSKTYTLAGGFNTDKVQFADVDAAFGIYGGYIGGKQKYTGNKIDQKGGYIGLSSELTKDNAFLLSTVNAGFINNEAENMYGTDKFDTRWFGIGLKGGYNYALTDSWTLQPNIYAGYTLVNTEDYTSKSGVRINNDNLNFFEIDPGFKLSKQIDNGWLGYIQGKYAIVMDNGGETTANEIVLPNISAKNYFEYGFGMNKSLTDAWSLNGEINRRDGGRSGWNGAIEFKYNF